MNKWLNLGGDASSRLDTGIVFWIRHYWEIRKVVNGYSFILIRQIAALVRRALAEVCTVPVLLVVICSYHYISRDDAECIVVTRVCVSVCVSVCPRPYAHTIARTQM